GVLRRVELTELVPDAQLAEKAFHTESSRLVRDDGNDVLADGLVAQQRLQDLHECHGGRDFALLGALEEALEGGERWRRQGLRLLPSCGQIAAQFHAPRLHVLGFRRSGREVDIGHVVELVVGNRDLESIAEYASRVYRPVLL